MSEAEQFLDAVFGRKPGDAKIVIWNLATKAAAGFFDPRAAAAFAVERGATHDVYVGCGLLGRDPAKGRGAARDVIGIPGLWADIDIAGPGHAEKKPYPPDIEAALWLVRGMPKAPSLVIDSGHGLHVWWLFERPWMFADEAEREAAARKARGWGEQIALRARTRGWTVDSVGDLARLLRLPGTFNHKGGAAVPVRFL